MSFGVSFGFDKMATDLNMWKMGTYLMFYKSLWLKLAPKEGA